jgi:hypothetical protein
MVDHGVGADPSDLSRFAVRVTAVTWALKALAT